MTFDGWLKENEVYSTRFERLTGDFTTLTSTEFYTLIKWLEAAYEEGYEEGCDDIYHQLQPKP